MAKRLTQPALEPVTLSDVKAQLNIRDTIQDGIITRRISEAREWAEEFMQRSLLPSDWIVVIDEFQQTIELAYPPIISVTTVKYIDVTGTQQTLSASAYSLDSYSEPGWLVPKHNTDWPDTLDALNAVEIKYSAGYATPDNIPYPIKEAILLLVGHWMNNQGAAESGAVITRVPLAVEQLLQPYRIIKV